MISSFGRGFDSLQLHNLDKKAADFQWLLFFLEGISVPPFFKDSVFKIVCGTG